MFDLFRSGERSKRILLGALLVLVALSMLTYLIPSYNNGSGDSASGAVVADVAGTEITTADVQKLVQATMKNKQFPAELLPNYLPNMVDQMVTERALAYEAKRLGIEVTDPTWRIPFARLRRACSRTASSSARTSTPPCWRSRT